MSAGAGTIMATTCARCDKRRAQVRNKLIGGDYCKPCDRYITSDSPELEAKYDARVAARKKESETK